MAGDRPIKSANRDCQGCRASYELCSNYFSIHSWRTVGERLGLVIRLNPTNADRSHIAHIHSISQSVG